MLIIKKLFTILWILFAFSTVAQSMTRLFYLQRTDTPTNIYAARLGFESFKNNLKTIDIVVPQAYQVDENGIVWGYVDHEVLSLAKDNSIKVMPLLTNAKFDKDTTHLFLQNTAAQEKAIHSLLNACTENHYYGIQLDFENVAKADKDQLTHFYTATTNALHKANFAVSIALPPMMPDDPTPSFIQKKFYENWEAAYDFKALGKISDFVTIMAYNQHGTGTTPGPSADIHWVETTIQFALKNIPAKKISLGIPAWSDYWYTDRSGESHKIIAQHIGMNYSDLMYLLKKFNVTTEWNDEDKISYRMFTHHWLKQYAFIEDSRSFNAKLALVDKYQLNGISLYALGMEDPQIWPELTKHK